VVAVAGELRLALVGKVVVQQARGRAALLQQERLQTLVAVVVGSDTLVLIGATGVLEALA
jgi:hypothetical protein